MVFSGRIREDEELKGALRFGIMKFIRKLLGYCYRPVDRIIVVCTSNPDVPLSREFFNAVWAAKKKHGGNYEMLVFYTLEKHFLCFKRFFKNIMRYSFIFIFLRVHVVLHLKSNNRHRYGKPSDE